MRVATKALLLARVICSFVTGSEEIIFGLLNGGSSFFEPVAAGFLQQCEMLGVACHVRVAGSGPCEEVRFNITREFLELGVNGIAMKPCSAELAIPLFQELQELGVSVVSLDSDVPESVQIAHIGTDNVFMGRTMARLLRQLRPEGGTYAMISSKDGRDEGFIQEIQRYNERDDRSHWHHVPALPEFLPDSMDLMEAYAVKNPSAIITMTQGPMKHPNWTQFVEQNRERNITYIGADGSDFQLEYLDQRYVDGLVGQLPYEMGTTAAQVLYDHYVGSAVRDRYPTNVVAYNLIPLELPVLEFDSNLIGNLRILGFSLYCINILCTFVCIGWTAYYRESIVVRAAQPFFLLMIAGGVLILCSALIPLSFDDGGDSDSLNKLQSEAICMSVPWLAFTGFTIIFAALFSKTWRVNRLFRAASEHNRITVTETDVLAPFGILMTGNIVVLVCWTVFDPLTYSRVERDGTDYWNRALESYGACTSDHSVRFLVPLGLLNVMAVVTACWQAIQARDLNSEFSEAKFIGLTVGSIFQAFLTGIPVVVVVRDIPEAYYSVLSVMLFLLSSVVLALIFLPKMVIHRQYSRMSEREQKQKITTAIRPSNPETSSLRQRSDQHSSGVETNAAGLNPNSELVTTATDNETAPAETTRTDERITDGESKESPEE